jgi:hypothetical protein
MKSFFIFLFSVYLPCQVIAQADDVLLAMNNEKGIFINIANPSLVGRPLELYRKAANETDFRKITTFGVVASQADLVERIESAKKIFIASKAPKDDGVAAVWKTYQTGNDTLRAFIASVPQLSFIFNTAYLDNDVKRNIGYQYQLRDAQRIIATSKLLLYTGSYPFPDLSAVVDSANRKAISFRVPYSHEFSRFITVDAKRKMFTAKQSEFKPVNISVSTTQRNNQTFLMLSDTSLKDFSEYNYRLRFQTIFGEKDTALYELNATNIRKSMLSVVKELNVVASKASRAFHIRWKLRDPHLVQSLALYRSEHFDGDYALIGHFNPSDTATIDPIEVANELYFYYMELTDLFGNKRKSIKIHAVYDGKHQPTPPIDLTGSASAHGLALSWKASDPHTRGFYVFRRSGVAGDFLQISPFIPIQNNHGDFLDSTSLHPDYTFYYAVKSESDTYDKSVFSDTISFRQASSKENLKPPTDVSAVFRNNKVFITWENMNALVSATAGYLLYRKKATDREYVLLTKEPLYAKNYFIDSTLLSGYKYHYAVASVDGSGNQSLKSIATTVDLANKFKIIPERLGFERQAAAIKLKWTSIDSNRIQNIKVYRAAEDQPFKLLSSVAKENQFYIDKAVVKGKLYSYRLVITDLEGTESKPTEALLVTF